ncbi:flagellar basal body rod C-terminal domain-containing protein [Undibacterium sp. Xuan67W]|uniref:flagellar basal body rod C-terminal domain-containing protein n=1 Tax=Undibacterium sp. Xuan67W TaxID=3413057 RepID=UPI003BF23BF2
MSISALNAGLSGLQSYQRALDNSANSVANASTNGFQAQQVSFQEQKNGGVTTTISNGVETDGSSTTPSGTDLTKEIIQSLEFKVGFDINAKVVKTADDILGTIINIKA